MRKIALLLSLAFIASLSLASFSRGATIVQTDPYSVTNGTSGSVLSSNLVFNQFNTSLGTLNSITLSFTGQFNGTATLTTTAGLGYTGHISDLFTLTASDGTSAPPGLASTLTSSVDSSPDFTITLQLFSAVTTPSQASGTVNPSVSSSTNLSSYLGAGTFNLKMKSTTSVTQTGGIAVISSSSSNTVATGNVVLTYNYTPTPEPSTAGLILGGLAFLAGMQILRRRRTVE